MSEREDFSIPDAATTYGEADHDYLVQGRGRPERNPRESAIRNLRRRAFGRRLRELRLAANLTLSRAAALSGMSSPRKLSQYETTCYPPGEIVRSLSRHYGVTERELADLVLRHSDPTLYAAITGQPGFEVTEAMITDYLLTRGCENAPAKPDGNIA